MDRYWIFGKHQPEGPYDIETLVTLPGFSPSTSVCRVGDDEWRAARDCAFLRKALPVAIAERPEWKPVRRPSAPRVVPAGDFRPLTAPAKPRRLAREIHPPTRRVSTVRRALRRTVRVFWLLLLVAAIHAAVPGHFPPSPALFIHAVTALLIIR